MIEKEIDLRDYIKLFIKNWPVFLRFILAFVIIGLVLAFYHPTKKVFQVSNLIEIGQIGKGGFLESPQQVIEKIRGGSFGSFPDAVIIVSNPIDTRLIKITIETTDQSKGVNYLNSIINSVINSHEAIVKFEKQSQNDIIKGIDEKIYKSKIEKNDLNKELKDSSLSLRGLLAVIIIGTIDKDIRDSYSNKAIITDYINYFSSTKEVGSTLILEKPMRNNFLFNAIIAILAGFFAGIFWIFFKNWIREGD